jgi:hypothetical protein
MKKPRIEILARTIALEILKSYHREIKSGFVSDSSAVEREKAQAAAFITSKLHIAKLQTDSVRSRKWLNERIEDE